MVALLSLLAVDVGLNIDRAFAPTTVTPAKPLVKDDGGNTKGEQGANDNGYSGTVVILTLLLNAATLGVIGFQGWVYNRQRQLMRGQLEAAVIAANAAADTAQIAKDALTSIEPAFV